MCCCVSIDSLSTKCLFVISVLYLFFFKQKTAYEMRISDWSSDVCSSDLHRWCSECLIVGEAIDREALRVQVAALGASSVVVAGSPTRVRVHAHVDRKSTRLNSSH